MINHLRHYNLDQNNKGSTKMQGQTIRTFNLMSDDELS